MSSKIHPCLDVKPVNGRVTEQQYTEFQKVYFGARIYLGQRFGQAFMNHFFPNISDAKVFYNGQIKDCMAEIETRYVQRNAR